MTGLVQEILLYPQKGAPPVAVPSAEIIPGKGVLGDHKRSPKRQVTLLSLEMWQRACRELGADLEPRQRRANVVLAGVELVLGKWIQLGEVVLRITEETKPCWRMNLAHPGLKKALTPELRAGVITVVELGGVIRIGDPVRILDQAPALTEERSA